MKFYSVIRPNLSPVIIVGILIFLFACQKINPPHDENSLALKMGKTVNEVETLAVSCQPSNFPATYKLDDQGCIDVYKSVYWFIAGYPCPGNSYLMNLKNKEAIKFHFEAINCGIDTTLHKGIPRSTSLCSECPPTEPRYYYYNVYGTNPITDISNELGVFSNYSNSTFTLYIRIDGKERIHGSCFFGFESNGKSRTLGFYSNNLIQEKSLYYPSAYLDNSNLMYTLKVQFTLHKLLISSILNTMYNNGISRQFSVDNYNSAHLAKEILEKLDVSIPASVTSPYELATYVRQYGLPGVLISGNAVLEPGMAPSRN